jgi:hypothetical protein
MAREFIVADIESPVRRNTFRRILRADWHRIVFFRSQFRVLGLLTVHENLQAMHSGREVRKEVLQGLPPA